MFLQLMQYRYLVPMAILIGLAPFYPIPHLAEKLKMLAEGTLRRPLDIFDLVWHAWPLALLGVRLGRDIGKRFSKQSPGQTGA